jgi:hypothetical protein
VPDLLICYKGRFVAMEIKVFGKERTTTVKQRMEIELIKKRGGVAAIVTTVADALKLLEGIDE